MHQACGSTAHGSSLAGSCSVCEIFYDNGPSGQEDSPQPQQGRAPARDDFVCRLLGVCVSKGTLAARRVVRWRNYVQRVLAK